MRGDGLKFKIEFEVEHMDVRNNPSLDERKGFGRRIARWRDGRVVEGAPLLRVYGSKAHRGFESLSLRQFWIGPFGPIQN